MKRILLLLILLNFGVIWASGQSFTVHDLLTLSALQTKDINHFMNKNGFFIYNNNMGADTMGNSFVPKGKGKKAYSGPEKSINLYQQGDSKYFILHTASLPEYLDGQANLMKSHYVYNTTDTGREPSMLFQKANIAIEATKETHDSITQYTFKLKVKKIPDSIVYAEDLLQFDSHEFLVSYFGEKNVKKDMYYFSEKELKKYSVLFSGTRHQAVFVWGDEKNLDSLSYILVPKVLPTEGGKRNTPFYGNNDWKFQTGIYSGMPLRDLLRLNEMDFNVYGNKSDLALMVKPGEKGKINFKKTAIMLSCSDCYDSNILNQREVSALDIAKANLSMRVLDIVLYP